MPLLPRKVCHGAYEWLFWCVLVQGEQLTWYWNSPSRVWQRLFFIALRLRWKWGWYKNLALNCRGRML